MMKRFDPFLALSLFLFVSGFWCCKLTLYLYIYLLIFLNPCFVCFWQRKVYILFLNFYFRIRLICLEVSAGFMEDYNFSPAFCSLAYCFYWASLSFCTLCSMENRSGAFCLKHSRVHDIMLPTWKGTTDCSSQEQFCSKLNTEDAYNQINEVYRLIVE